jgi:hypothetical protein
MLHMEDVRRVLRPKVMRNRGQQARGCVTCRWDDWAVETRKSLLHQHMPRVLIAGVGRLLQDNVMAHGLRRHQAKPPCTRFILRHCEGFGGQVFGQTRAFLSAIRHDRLLHLTVALVLSPIGSPHKSIQTRALQQEAPQANPTSADCGAHQGYPENQAMEEGQTWGTVKKGHDGGMLVEALLVRPPCPKRAAGNMQSLGCLTQGEPLGLQSVILVKECSASGAIPAWAMILVASLLVLDDGSHNDLLFHPSPLCRDG